MSEELYSKLSKDWLIIKGEKVKFQFSTDPRLIKKLGLKQGEDWVIIIHYDK